MFTTPQYSSIASATPTVINDVTAYMAYMQKTMKSNWNPPEFDNSMTATVMFTIMKDGTITNPKIKTSSGNSDMDNVAMATVKKVEKLPPLPNELAKKHGKIDTLFTFEYNVHKKNKQ